MRVFPQDTRRSSRIDQDLRPHLRWVTELANACSYHAILTSPEKSARSAYKNPQLCVPVALFLLIKLICPPDDDLLNRRRLGKTKLAVKPGQVGTSNATKEENLGPFEYAHLRAPLPKDLKGSEIFGAHENQAHPESYFLMVRMITKRGLQACLTGH